MNDALTQLVNDLATDPRQYVTKKLLDLIAAVWRDEERISIISLDFNAEASLFDEDKDKQPVMTWFAYPRNERADFAEFASVHLHPGPQEPEYTAADRVEFAEWQLTDAQKQVERANQAVVKVSADLSAARDRAASELAQMNGEADA